MLPRGTSRLLQSQTKSPTISYLGVLFRSPRNVIKAVDSKFPASGSFCRCFSNSPVTADGRRDRSFGIFGVRYRPGGRGVLSAVSGGKSGSVAKTASCSTSVEEEIEEVCPSESSFCRKVKADVSSRFPAEPDRYHLYTTLTCPFAARALIAIKLKGLDDVISCTILDPVKQPGDPGYRFTDTKPRCSLDTVNGCKFFNEIYELARPNYSGNVTVPVLWDKKKGTLVNNESADLLRMFNTEFNDFCSSEEASDLDLYPESIRSEIDEMNHWIQEDLTIGVYRAGFARDQEGYDVASNTVFKALDKVEEILSNSRYLMGDFLTEADVRLFSTLIRFDIAYYDLLMCNKKRITDFPNTWRYTMDIYRLPGVADTVDFTHIKTGYWQGFPNVHPSRIVPIGPDMEAYRL